MDCEVDIYSEEFLKYVYSRIVVAGRRVFSFQTDEEKLEGWRMIDEGKLGEMTGYSAWLKNIFIYVVLTAPQDRLKEIHDLLDKFSSRICLEKGIVEWWSRWLEGFLSAVTVMAAMRLEKERFDEDLKWFLEKLKTGEYD
jgi:hypothetical protein